MVIGMKGKGTVDFVVQLKARHEDLPFWEELVKSNIAIAEAYQRSHDAHVEIAEAVISMIETIKKIEPNTDQSGKDGDDRG